MSTEFDPNIVAFGDRTGLGRWEIGHYRQHLRYVGVLAIETPPIIIADHPILSMGDTDLTRRVWLADHYQVHLQLRVFANISGVDLSIVDFKKKVEFFQWMDDHAAEHALLDSYFGVS